MEYQLKCKGIYQITGNNGSGKTSYIETVLKKNRHLNQLDIAYFSQQNWKYKMSGKEYLEPANQNKELVNEYSNIFSIDFLNKNITELSGGEFIKLKIIRMISLDSSILVFDEPTNQLDDKSTEIFKKLIVELSQKKLIIIITHDMRLDSLEVKKVPIDEVQKKEFKLPEKKGKNISEKNIIKNLLISKYHFILVSLIMIISILSTIVFSYIILYNIPVEHKLQNDSFVELLDIHERYDRYYQTVYNSFELDKKFINEEQYLTVNNLVDLSDESFVDVIYLVDYSYLNSIDLESDELNIISMPEMIFNSPNYESSFPNSKKFVSEGRLPKDYKNECTVSFVQMKKNGYSNVEIGDEIQIENYPYTIVGFTDMPVTILSFNNNFKNGIIEVTKKEKESMNQSLQLMTLDGYDDPYFSLIFVETNNQIKLFDYLEKYGYSYQISSNYVNKEVQVFFLKKEFPKILIMVCLFMLVMCSILYVYGNKAFSMVNSYIQDITNINFKVKRNLSLIYSLILVDLFFGMIVSIRIYKNINSDGSILLLLPLLLCTSIFFIVTTILMFKKVNKDV